MSEKRKKQFEVQEALLKGEPVDVPIDGTEDATEDAAENVAMASEEERGFNVGAYQKADAKETADTYINTGVSDAIGKEEIRKAREILRKYKDGKAALERKIVKNEQWWKMRHWDLEETTPANDPKPASGWLFNCIMSKHADFMDNFPSPAILPREPGDDEQATMLTDIMPVILEQNDFEQIYSDEINYKLKNGTGCYGVFWDKDKLNGLGDIKIESVDLLSLFWEPGITDLQKSSNLFYTELVNRDVVEANYPGVKLKPSKDMTMTKYILDENIDTSDKVLVIDWYYKKRVNGRDVLHYCKFVDEEILYASENDTTQPMHVETIQATDINGMPILDEMGLPVIDTVNVPDGEPMNVRGWYDHGKYPYIFDVLFKEEGMPVGFGFVDVCKSAQMSIDTYNNAFEKSLIFNATPRHFMRNDSSVNEEEFLDPNCMLVHVDGNLGTDALRPVEQRKLDSIYVNVLNNKIEELKETSGNRDVNNGGTSAGATAASAIVALQEQSGKVSRNMIKGTYRAYQDVITMCIELIRQFYDLPRQFRITGKQGETSFVTFDNSGLKPQSQGMDFGVDMGYRLPVFDIKVQAQKESKYSQISQNELALQIYNAGMFNPELADQALATLDMMEFQGKEDVMAKIQENGGMYRQLLMLQQQLLQLSQVVDAQNGTMLAETAANAINGNPNQPQANVNMTNMGETTGSAIVDKARDRAAAAASPQ